MSMQAVYYVCKPMLVCSDCQPDDRMSNKLVTGYQFTSYLDRRLDAVLLDHGVVGL